MVWMANANSMVNRIDNPIAPKPKSRIRYHSSHIIMCPRTRTPFANKARLLLDSISMHKNHLTHTKPTISLPSSIKHFSLQLLTISNAQRYLDKRSILHTNRFALVPRSKKKITERQAAKRVKS